MRALPPLVVDTTIAAALFFLAVLIRLPYLEDIPAYTDEVAEVNSVLEIVVDGARPLVHTEAYRGPVWPYMLAGWLEVVGLRPAAPRVFAMLLGSLTVPAAYVFARVLSGRAAGVVAGLLLATSFSHITLNSHVAWSNNSTPLWTTAALTATVIGAGGATAIRDRRRPGAWLALAGIVWGLSLHTHPAALALLAGAAVWFVATADRRALLRTPGPWVGVALAAIALSPIIVHNVSNDWIGYYEATAPSQTVAADRGPLAVAARAPSLVGQLGRMAGAGPLDEPIAETARLSGRALGTARPAATLLYALVLVGSLVFAAARGPRVLAVVAGVACVVLLLINDSYLSYYDTRYMAIVLPLAYAAVGAVVADRLLGWAPGRAIALVGLSALMIYSLVVTTTFYEVRAATGPSNEAMRLASDRLAHRPSMGEHTFVDKGMRPLKLGGGGDPTRAFGLLLTLRGVGYDLSDTDEIRWFLLNDDETTFWIVAEQGTADTLVGEFDLRAWEQGAGWIVLEREGRSAAPESNRP